MSSVDEEWDKFLSGSDEYITQSCLNTKPVEEIPKCSDIYISTKTVIAYLNQPINLKDVFWFLTIIPYGSPQEGITGQKQTRNNGRNRSNRKENSKMRLKIDRFTKRRKSERHAGELKTGKLNGARYPDPIILGILTQLF